ncbi:hypothetical protein [Agrobacterium vitis]|uniref:hypothetical protein n=1 Tax=Agrobacterium vitis TaxID=373 RepID=UPI0012E9659F|nr:hypothetical protein [Agrobacterium vitis]MUZ65680.1 hypothetical protein [Agrobacterium vitis]
MLKIVDELRAPDPFYAGAAGFVGSTLEALHDDMLDLELSTAVPDSVRRIHDAVRHAYIYSYYSYDLLTLAASEAFPCLELALRERIGDQFLGRVYKNGRSNPPRLDELLKAAERQGLIVSDITYLSELRNLFLHGSETVLNPPMFLTQFQVITRIIQELYEPIG